MADDIEGPCERRLRGKDALSQSITILLISLRYDGVKEKSVINGINGNGSYIQRYPITARHCLAITVSHSINTGEAKRINVAVQTRASYCQAFGRIYLRTGRLLIDTLTIQMTNKSHFFIHMNRPIVASS